MVCSLESEIDLWQLNEYTDMKPGLERIRAFLAGVGNPQKSFRSVIITGTNGKGSTAKILSEILICAGYKVGLYTSPHLVKVNERIQVNSKQISDKNFKALAGRYLPGAKKYSLTYFEFITAVAFIYFAQEKIDIGVLEIGLGGRFDAVNVIDKPELSIITDVDYDHCKVLGNSLSQIAFEKAGIIRTDGTLISGSLNSAAVNTIRKTAAAKNSSIYELNKGFRYKVVKTDWIKGFQRFEFAGIDDKKYVYELYLLGQFQLKNSSLALAAAQVLMNKGFNLTPLGIKEALKRVKWPARFDVRKSKNKTFIIDGAHNPGAVKNFIDTLKISPWGSEKQVYIFGILKDKNYKAVIKQLSKYVKEVILVQVESKRNLPLKELLKCWSKYLPAKNIKVSGNVLDALRKTRKEKIIIVIGSLYLAGKIIQEGGKYDKTLFRS